MKLSPRRFTIEEFGEQQNWIGSLLSPINQLVSELFAGLANNITVSENLFQEIKELKFVADSSIYPIRFKTKFNKHPVGLYAIYCKDSTGATSSDTPWISWSFSDGQLTITNITNLTASSSYTLKLLLIYG